MKNLKNSDISIEDIPSDLFICRLIDNNFIIIDTNITALQSMGMQKKDVVGKDILNILSDIKESDFLATLHEANNSSRMIEFDIPCYIHDNLCSWYKGSVKKLFNGDLLLYYKNIEREKELEIEELRYQLNLISEAPYVGICIFDKKFLYANHVLEAILGYSFEELQQIIPIDLLHLNDKDEYICNLQKRMEGERFTTAYYDAKLLRKDNREIFARLCIKTVKYKGKYAALASVIDITHIVKQKQKTKRLAQALEQTDDLLLITDKDAVIIDMNNSVTEKMGYTRTELIGQPINIFRSGKHGRKFYKRLWDTVLGGDKYQNIIINKTKKGRLIYLDTIITPVFDEEGKIESFVLTARDISKDVKIKERLQKLATQDALTQIYNRYAINQEIDNEMKLAKRDNKPFALLMVDIDFFKLINDTHGHPAGDLVLKETAALMKKSIRDVDKIGRWGGEEFMIVLHNISAKEAVKKAEEIRLLIKDNLVANSYHITISIGVRAYHKRDTKNLLLQKVDDALYQAKEKGRNRVVIL
jgi:diguanylate cyclase (GGDEF)-like protein/PAS domain S-box-containing protein